MPCDVAPEHPSRRSCAHRRAGPLHPEWLLVLYLESQGELDAIAERIGQTPITPTNPYWQRNAQAYTDPDGFQLLLTVGS